ncbi:MAG: SRPBCC family protein [Acidobacteriota bacterium]|nr:SRPBCC family protein [Acidobacteriota bacterium]
MFERSHHEVTVTLPSDREICFSRFFEWPRHLVFEAWTNPEHVRHWWGCAGSTLTVCEIDLRPGGAWRIVMRMADGSEHPFKGVYREIVPSRRLVYTECYDMPGIGSPEWLTTVTFEDLDGKTKLTNSLLHRSVQARDGHLQAGMEPGMTQTLNRLAEHVALMARQALGEHDEGIVPSSSKRNLELTNTQNYKGSNP